MGPNNEYKLRQITHLQGNYTIACSNYKYVERNKAKTVLWSDREYTTQGSKVWALYNYCYYQFLGGRSLPLHSINVCLLDSTGPVLSVSKKKNCF